MIKTTDPHGVERIHLLNGTHQAPAWWRICDTHKDNRIGAVCGADMLTPHTAMNRVAERRYLAPRTKKVRVFAYGPLQHLAVVSLRWSTSDTGISAPAH